MTAKLTEMDILKLAEAKIEEEHVQCHTPEPTAGRFTIEEMKQAIREQHDGDGWLYTQIHRNRFVFDHTRQAWFEWRGHYWAEDMHNESLAAFDPVIDELSLAAAKMQWLKLKATKEGEDEKAKEAASWESSFLKRVSELRTLGRKKVTLTLAAAGKRSLGISGQEWDSKPWPLGCKNGVLDLREKSFAFRPGRQDDFIKTFSPVEWRGINEPAYVLEAFLKSTLNGDDELIAYLRRLCGYALTGTCHEHVLPILWGKGRNGKGTFLQAIADVLGDLAGPVQSEMLLDQGRLRSSAGPTSDIMALRGRRLAWASETDEGRKLNAGKVKWLVGGDTLVGREPYARCEVSFKPTHTLFLLTNHKPKADPDDFALWQRIHLIPFTQSFVDNPTRPDEKPRDPKLAEKLKAEAPGILAWMVRGCLEWQRQGLNPPASVLSATNDYRQDEDLLGQFLAECCVQAPHAWVKAGEIRKAYEGWCGENGHHPVSGYKFSKYLLARYDRDDSSRHRSYLGVGLKVEQ